MIQVAKHNNFIWSKSSRAGGNIIISRATNTTNHESSPTCPRHRKGCRRGPILGSSLPAAMSLGSSLPAAMSEDNEHPDASLLGISAPVSNRLFHVIDPNSVDREDNGIALSTQHRSVMARGTFDLDIDHVLSQSDEDIKANWRKNTNEKHLASFDQELHARRRGDKVHGSVVTQSMGVSPS